MKFLSISSSIRKRFTDTFNRSNTLTELGASSDGSLWKAVRGSFKIASNKATTTDPSAYPIATINMPPNPSGTTSISLTGASTGTGASIWVTDQDNWFAVASVQTPSTICDSCNDCTSPLQCSGGYNGGGTYISGGALTGGGNYASGGAYSSGGNYASGGNVNATYYNTQNCPGGFNACNNGFNCVGAYNKRYCTGGTNPNTGGCPKGYNSGGTCIGGFQCNAPRNCSGGYNGGGNYSSGGNTNPTNYNAIVYSAYTYNVYTYSAYSYNTQTCPGGINACNTGYGAAYACRCQPTTYPSYIRFFKSTAGAVTQLSEFLVGSLATTVIGSLKVLINGNQVTVKSYSDPNLVTQIGSDIVYTPTGAAVTTEYGIIVVPSTYNQTTAIDEITIEKG